MLTPAPTESNAPSRTSAIDVDTPPWYLAYTKPRQEHIAEDHLGRQGYHTYLPRYKNYAASASKTQLTGGFVHEPMFPRYVFFRPGSVRQGVSAARSTRGVCSLVSFGSGPAAVPPELLHSIQTVERQRDQAELKTVSPFQPGTRVRLRGQSMKSLHALVLSVTNQRVTLLIDILGRQQMVEVEHAMLELH